MAQISNANLQTVIDKMTRHAAETDGVALASNLSTYATTAPNGGLQTANTDVISALQTLIAGLADIFQVGDLSPSVENLGSPLIQSFIFSIWSAVRQALNTHGMRYNAFANGDLSGLDTMLRVINASAPTLRAHGLFSKYFGGLSPANVFTPTPSTLATIAVTGATSATLTHVAAIDATLYAPGQIKILNTKTEGLTSTTLNLTGTKSGTSGTAFSATVAATTNNLLTVCSDTTLTWTDCTVLSSISGGVSGDTFSVVIVPDRVVNAA